MIVNPKTAAMLALLKLTMTQFCLMLAFKNKFIRGMEMILILAASAQSKHLPIDLRMKL